MLAGLGDPWRQVPADAVDRYKTRLDVGGQNRVYIGDPQIWPWYRGAGSGPYPCRSALLALERVCDQAIAIGYPLRKLTAALLADCENLAMLGLATGLIVRHIEQSEDLLDPFLAEPEIWELEFARVTHEATGLVAKSEDATHPERRQWSLRDAAMQLIVRADPVRAAELKAVGSRLVAAAEQLASTTISEDDHNGANADSLEAQYRTEYLARVSNWACSLDHERYQLFTEDGQAYLQPVPPADVQAAITTMAHESARNREILQLHSRYCLQQRVHEQPATIAPEQLLADLTSAKSLLEDQPSGPPVNVWDAVAGVSAVALEKHLVQGEIIDTEAIQFAADVIIAVAEGAAPALRHEFEGTYFEWGNSRTAARAITLLLLPTAATLLEAYSTANNAGREFVIDRARSLAQAVATETRLHLARGLDQVWKQPCHLNPCNHEIALSLIMDTLHDCLLGEWDQEGQQRPTVTPQEPVAESLRNAAAQDIYVSKLDPAIRALGTAITAETCVHDQAKAILLALLEAQRHALRQEPDYDDRGSHTLAAARALLQLAHTGTRQPLTDHIAVFSEHDQLLDGLLRAVAAAAEETPTAAETARQIWPQIISQTLALLEANGNRSEGNYLEDSALAALIPNRVYDGAFLYRELHAAPITWADTNTWRPGIDAWLAAAVGRPQCVDSLISMIQTLRAADQISYGLPWVARLIPTDARPVVGRTYLLNAWLKEIRSAVEEMGALPAWQELVDSLVVAGDTVLAPYSE